VTEPEEYCLYLRKSNGRAGIPRQRTITSAFIAERGGVIFGEFSDEDSTAFRKPGGKQPERDDFTRMLAVVAARPGLRVASWHADRLTRNPEDTERLIEVCASGGHLVVTATSGTYDLGSANGKKSFRSDANDGAYEVDHMMERMLPARAAVAAEGRWLGGRRPFGFEPDPGPVLLPDGTPWLDEDGNPVRGILRLRPAEAEALAAAHRAVLDGASVGGIARDWNAAGILTPAGNRWRGNEVGRVLRRPRNAALMEYQGQVTGTAQWPAVVDEETWNKVVKVLDNPQRRSGPGPARKHLLSFVATCGLCGGPVLCGSSRGSNSRPRRKVYRCREGAAKGHVARDQAATDGFIVALAIARLSRPDAVDLLIPDRRELLAALNRDASAVRELMAADRRLQQEGLLTEMEFRSGRRQHLADLALIQQKIEDASEADVLAQLIRDDPEASQDQRERLVREKWAALGLDRRRAVIAALMTITIMPAPKGRPAGWKPGTSYFDPRSVRIEWRR
jgi:DNA invertase Pin-like site-specific DNA recombinase